MARLLLILAIIGLVIFLLRKLARPNPSAEPEATPLVTCAHCGVSLPEPQAVRDGKTFYCSTEHLRAGPKR